MRLFIAIPCPEEVKANLKKIQQTIKTCGELKLVEGENIHLTLKFLGEVPEDNAEKILDALSVIEGEKRFNVCVKGLGVFPKPSSPRVVWAGVAEGSSKICELNAKVDDILTPFGFQREERFHPHFTVARVKYVSHNEKLAKIIAENKNMEYGAYPAEKITLMQSTLTPKGPSYKTLREYNLHGC